METFGQEINGTATTEAGRPSVAVPPFPDAATAPELAFAWLADQARLLAEREVSSRELVELSLARIEESQPRLNAFRVVCAESALAEADRADARLSGGTAARPRRSSACRSRSRTTSTSPATRPRSAAAAPSPSAGPTPSWSAACARAGAIIVGKTQAPEVGQWHFTESPTFGATRNPWHEGHAPGGSSGGAAAAVAAGLVAGAIGSDGAGSIRIPAAWCGLVGLKPQRGRISTWPDAEAFHGLTVLGPLARSAEDAGLLLDAVAGNVPADRHHVAPASEPFAEAARARTGTAADRDQPQGPLRHPRPPLRRAPRRDLRDGGAPRRARPRSGRRGPRLRPRRPGAGAARHGRRARLGARPRHRRLGARAPHPRPRPPRRAARAARRCARPAPPSPPCAAASAAPSSATTSSSPRSPPPRRRASASTTAAATGRPAAPPASHAPSPSPGTSPAGPRSASPTASPPPACRSAPSSSPTRARSPCSLLARQLEASVR